ncbi:MAG: YbdK family carboxylate-amine ligase [Actinomycetota bacterium]|nr:YbdK family carboxylate-amine ligase [Actinomycetota bacterium]
MIREAASTPTPAWAEWAQAQSYTVGIEEEVMLIDPSDWSLAQRSEHVLPELSPALQARLVGETHAAVVELSCFPHGSIAEVGRELAASRVALEGELAAQGLRAASGGTHPCANWTETRISAGERYRAVHESMRELARREPTCALHVHVGVADPDRAIALQNRLRVHIPLLLALSANSPYWQGRDSGLASVRTPIFQAFPRVGIPRPFGSYAAYVETVDELLRCDAIPEPTFLWWDVRCQPRFGTVELRVMDAQTTATDTAAIAALVQTIAHLELEAGYADDHLIQATEILDENRFLAARDGMQARLIDPAAERRVPAMELLERLLAAGREHAEELGCEPMLELVRALARAPGAARQRSLAEADGIARVIPGLADRYPEPFDL